MYLYNTLDPFIVIINGLKSFKSTSIFMYDLAVAIIIYYTINKTKSYFCWGNGKNYEIKTWHHT